MHVVIRSYSGQGASELFDLAGQRTEELKTVISGRKRDEAEAVDTGRMRESSGIEPRVNGNGGHA